MFKLALLFIISNVLFSNWAICRACVRLLPLKQNNKAFHFAGLSFQSFAWEFIGILIFCQFLCFARSYSSFRPITFDFCEAYVHTMPKNTSNLKMYTRSSIISRSWSSIQITQMYKRSCIITRSWSSIQITQMYKRSSIITRSWVSHPYCLRRSSPGLKCIRCFAAELHLVSFPPLSSFYL